MAYITPNSDVHILKGVPLDRSYNHTLRQTSTTGQYNTLVAYNKYTLSNQSYQRAGKGKIRVAILADNLYDCNYMIFRNTAYGSKWFYAFIDSVDYINDNASEINYTIDVMQTWYFDYDLGSCYVEREHSLTDVAGENLVPESLDTGDLIPMQKEQFCYPTDSGSTGIMYMCVVFYVPNNTKQYVAAYSKSGGVYSFTLLDCQDSGEYNTGELINKIYAGCKYFGIPMEVNTITEIEQTKKGINKLIATILGNDVGGSIVNICQVPYDIYVDWVQNHGSSSVRYKQLNQINTNYNPTGASSYTPKNKKLLTHPFRNIVVSNNAGQTATYKWEYFNYTSDTGLKRALFCMVGVPLLSPEIMCYPTAYRNILTDYESGIILNDFPEPPWSEDSFAKWWSQNREAYVTSLVSTAVLAVGAVIATVATGGGAAVAGAGAAGTAAAGGATAGLTGGQIAALVGTGLSTGSKIANSIGSYTTAKNTPDQISGQAGISSLRTIQNRVGFYFYDMGVEKDKAKVIDDYFTMFGYAVKQVKVPNIRQSGVTLRPHWNYVKTSACIIHSASGKGLPAEDEEMVAKIYDNGITFWNNASEVGNYALDNSPV